MGPPVTVFVVAVLITASYGLPRLGRDDDPANFIGDGTSEIATAMLQSYIDEEKNTAFSPMGYSALMAILAEGAGGDTKTQLVNALHLPSDDQVTRIAYKNVLENLKEKHQLNVPEFHTWFYVYKNFSIEPEYKRVLLENYLTQVRAVEPLYETAMVDPPSPELDAMMNLDQADKEKGEKDKESMEPDKQSSMSENKDMMKEKEEMKPEKSDAMTQKEGMTDDKKEMMPDKTEEMMKEDMIMMSDKTEEMPEKQSMESDKDKNMPEKETEFIVTPEMIENKPDSIKDPFIEELLNKEREAEEKKDKKEKEEMKTDDKIKDSEMKGETASTDNKEKDMMSGDEKKEDMTEKEISRLRRSVKHSDNDKVPDKKQDESMTEEKKDSMMKEEENADSYKMEESLLTHAMEEHAIIEEAIKSDKQQSSQEKDKEEEPKKEMSTSEMQQISEMDKKPAKDEMNEEMSSMDMIEKEKPSMGDKDKKKSDIKKEVMETMGGNKRLRRGVLGNQDVTSGISGNNIVSKASEKPGESIMIVFNALYYKGSWATAFDPRKKEMDDVFYTSATEKLPVPTMHTSGTFNMANIPELDSVAIELPYKGDRYSLLVVLPNQRDGLRPLVADHLTKFPLKNIFKKLSPKQAHVCLPSFEVETTTNPKDALGMLGVSDVFSKEKANLSGISKESGLFVDELAQFVTIRVEPDHSEANYLTGSNTDKAETRTGDEEKFIADHPFLFFVADRKNHNMIVVAGKVTDPTYKTSPFIKKVKF